MESRGFASRCRLCGQEDNDTFVDIFNDNQKLQLENKIMKLLPIVVMPWDPMPHKVCWTCINKLNSFNEFYNETIKTDCFLRTLYPSAPESETENRDPMILINDQVRTFRNPLKLFPKSVLDTLKPSISKNESDNQRKSNPLLPATRQKTLDGFIVNPITRTDSVFTCQKCFSIFTKESTAVSHSCTGIEDKSEETHPERLLPPLKIRLITFQSGKFVCSLCQSLFVNKSEVVEHLQTHFTCERPTGKRKKKVGNRKRKKKRNTGTGRKKSRFDSPGKEIQTNVNLQSSEKSNKEAKTEQTTSWSYSQVTGAEESTAVEDVSVDPTVSLSKDNSGESPQEVVIIEDDDQSDNEIIAEFYSCKLCHKLFLSKESLIEHQRTHLCEMQKSLGTQQIINKSCEEDDSNTVTSSTEAVVYICRICSKTFSEFKNLTRHHLSFCQWLG